MEPAPEKECSECVHLDLYQTISSFHCVSSGKLGRQSHHLIPTELECLPFILPINSKSFTQ